jgi:chromosome segregation ATPase
MDNIKENQKTISPENKKSVNSTKSSNENSTINLFKGKDLNEMYSSYKRDLGLSKFTVKRAIKSVGEWIMTVDNNRKIQIRSDFDEEKEYKLEKQKEIQSHIEELSNDYENEKKITYFNEKINQHKELLSKYSEIKNKIDDKIKIMKEMIPELEKKILGYKIELRRTNKENLKLMEQINKIENDLSNKLEEDLEKLNYDLYNNKSNESINFNNSQISGNNSSIMNYSIDVSEILEKNENMREKMKKIDSLKEFLKEKKEENDFLIKNINQMNNNYFRCKKIYREGMHEIAKELLRINEIELDKVINNTNTTFNSLYFDIFKTNSKGKINYDFLKIPIINDNIKTKFKFPIVEKIQPNDLLYKVVKNIIEENNTNNKINNIKKNKFSWDEFKDFSAYQIYTLLNINKEYMDKLDNCLFN